jgi:hypothetical protein
VAHTCTVHTPRRNEGRKLLSPKTTKSRAQVDADAGGVIAALLPALTREGGSSGGGGRRLRHASATLKDLKAMGFNT